MPMNRSSRTTILQVTALSTLVAASMLAGCFNVAAPIGSRDECTKSGGVCVPSGDCAPGGGTVSSECYVEGVDSTECCHGTAPQKEATTCAAQGGICLPFPDCAGGRGYIAIQDEDCGGRADVACCIPRESCGGDPTFQCCNKGLADDPRCDNGVIVCGPSDSRVEFYIATCEQR